jgi:hypothetical protein
MENAKQLIKLENIKKNVDQKIQQVKNKILLDNSHQRQKENNHKKKIARTFLSSKIFKLVGNNSFSMYELFTIAGLIILNDLQKYDSATLVASYNQIIDKAIKDGDYKSELAQIGKERYIEDRTIEKDIEPALQLIHAILIEAKLLIEKLDLDKLKEEGNKYFIARRNIQVQKKIDKALQNIYKEKRF